MNRRLALWVPLVATLLVARAAQRAGPAEVTIGYQGLPYKASGESKTGIQVSEGVLLHVGAGAEAGYDTNVFYRTSMPIASPIIRTSCSATCRTRRAQVPAVASHSMRAPASSTGATVRRRRRRDLQATRGCLRPGSR